MFPLSCCPQNRDAWCRAVPEPQEMVSVLGGGVLAGLPTHGQPCGASSTPAGSAICPGNLPPMKLGGVDPT